MRILLIITLFMTSQFDIYAQSNSIDSLIITDKYRLTLLDAISKVNRLFDDPSIILIDIGKDGKQIRAIIQPAFVSYIQMTSMKYYGYFKLPQGSVIARRSIVLVTSKHKKFCEAIFKKTSKTLELVMPKTSDTLGLITILKDDYYPLTFVYKDNKFILQE